MPARRLLRTTRGRVALVAFGLLAAVLLVTNGAVLVSLSLLTEREVDAALAEQGERVARDFRADGTVQSGDLSRETLAGVAVDTVVVRSDGSVIARSPNQPFGPGSLAAITDEARTEKVCLEYITDEQGIVRRVYATELRDDGVILIVSRSQTLITRTLISAGVVLGALSLLLLASGSALAYWLADRTLRPVRTIASLAREISEHDLHRRVDVKATDDELGELVETFNAMLARLEAAFDGLRRFTADASHELRSPLALMRSELERGLARTRTAEEYREVLQSALRDVEHLATLVDQLLVLTQSDAGTLRLVRESVDVADFLYESAARWGAAAEEKEVSIEVDAPASGSVLADPALLRRVVDNLLANAIRHAPPFSVIRLRALRNGPGLDLEVADEGPGIPSEFRPRLFKRFARPDAARSRAEGGAGLGLALSAAIARAHGGQLELVEREGSGSTFRLHLPDAPVVPAA